MVSLRCVCIFLALIMKFHCPCGQAGPCWEPLQLWGDFQNSARSQKDRSDHGFILQRVEGTGAIGPWLWVLWNVQKHEKQIDWYLKLDEIGSYFVARP